MLEMEFPVTTASSAVRNDPRDKDLVKTIIFAIGLCIVAVCVAGGMSWLNSLSSWSPQDTKLLNGYDLNICYEKYWTQCNTFHTGNNISHMVVCLPEVLTDGNSISKNFAPCSENQIISLKFPESSMKNCTKLINQAQLRMLKHSIDDNFKIQLCFKHLCALDVLGYAEYDNVNRNSKYYVYSTKKIVLHLNENNILFEMKIFYSNPKVIRANNNFTVEFEFEFVNNSRLAHMNNVPDFSNALFFVLAASLVILSLLIFTAIMIVCFTITMCHECAFQIPPSNLNLFSCLISYGIQMSFVLGIYALLSMFEFFHSRPIGLNVIEFCYTIIYLCSGTSAIVTITIKNIAGYWGSRNVMFTAYKSNVIPCIVALIIVVVIKISSAILGIVQIYEWLQMVKDVVILLGITGISTFLGLLLPIVLKPKSDPELYQNHRLNMDSEHSYFLYVIGIVISLPTFGEVYLLFSNVWVEQVYDLTIIISLFIASATAANISGTFIYDLCNGDNKMNLHWVPYTLACLSYFPNAAVILFCIYITPCITSTYQLILCLFMTLVFVGIVFLIAGTMSYICVKYLYLLISEPKACVNYRDLAKEYLDRMTPIGMRAESETREHESTV